MVKKRILSIALALCLVLTALPLSGVLALAATSGDFEYEVLSETDKTCVITDYTGTATELEIPSILDGYTVTSIGDFAFFYCTSLTSINIPDDVTSIGVFAFGLCTSLTSMDIPDGVTSIGDSAFAECTSLTSINIPNSITSIGASAFIYCTSLTSIDVAADNPNYSSQEGVLFNKDKTELLMYPAKKIDTFYSIPDTVTSIEGSAFSDCTSLTSINIPTGVTSIGDSAFYRCTSLTSINIPDGVTYIGNRTFTDCSSLTNIDIPDSVTSIGGGAFSSCRALTNIDIPDSVTSIGASAFNGCTSLTSIEIPDGVTSIGDHAFMGCTSLTSIDISDSVTSIGDSAFEGCTSMTSMDIPDSVTSIGWLAFYDCTSLTSVFIPESVAYIASNAFSNCENVTIYGAAGSYAETYAEQNDIPFVGVSPTLAKDRSQVRFTAENGDIADAFDYRLISSIPDAAWDLYFDNGSGGTTITAVGFVAANESDRATLAGAQAAVEAGTALPAGWKTADTDYIQKTGDDADAYFGCIIKGIKHSEQTEDIVCSAYIAYTTAAGQTAYVWYDAPIVAPVATNYDAAADAWREMNA